MLEPALLALGIPIRVTSGYRSPVLNRTVGGNPRSQHMLGEAVDIVCDDNKRLYEWLRDNAPYDQLIWERGDDHSPPMGTRELHHPTTEPPTDTKNKIESMQNKVFKIAQGNTTTIACVLTQQEGVITLSGNVSNLESTVDLVPMRHLR